ncbi:MAG: hypothetical protein KGR17_08560 [Acidobacteria bacterium]|nr:hypothetical protein [Acidobacteriota bacterium]
MLTPPAPTPPPPIDLLSRISLGRGITRGGVTLIPIFLPGLDAPRVLTGDGAALEVAEIESASVPTIRVTNPGADPVLLVEGETIRGGLQQRTFNVSVVVPPGSTLEVPVSCVEAGRWSGGREFRKGRSFAPRGVRRNKQRGVRDHVERFGAKHSDQSAVWAGVDETLHACFLESPTRNVADADQVLERDDHRRRALEDLTRRGPLPGQCGVVVCHGKQVVAVELFGSPELLRAQWTPLVRGILLDAPDEVTGRPSLDRALRFLERVQRAERTVAPGVGLGEEHHLQSRRVQGQILTWDSNVLHASAFALAA